MKGREWSSIRVRQGTLEELREHFYTLKLTAAEREQFQTAATWAGELCWDDRLELLMSRSSREAKRKAKYRKPPSGPRPAA